MTFIGYTIISLFSIAALATPLGRELLRPQENTAATSAIAPSPNASKAGLAWPNGKWDDIKQFQSTGKVSWYYTWSPFSVETAHDLDFVPMLWGPAQVNDFSRTINDSLRTGSRHVLTINEPQEGGQSNMTPIQGAAFWQTYIQPLKIQQPDIRLGSPATSSAPSGKKWIQDWLLACNGTCTIDFIALHWYDVNATDFIRYLTDFHDTFRLPLWVTEWACQNYNNKSAQCTQQHVVDFLNVTQTFMDTTDWVERYAYFGAMKNLQGVNPYNALMDSNGKITPLGEQYIGAVKPNISDPSGNGPLAPAPIKSAAKNILIPLDAPFCLVALLIVTHIL